jgi:hypothetical protein
MRFQSKWAMGVIATFMVFGLVGCVAQATTTPNRTVDISMDQALTAQNKLGDLMMGSVEWTESEFSSLLSVLLEQNAGENNPIEGVTVWFEADNQIYIRVMLEEGLVPGVTSVDVAGTVGVENNHVVVDVTQAGASGISLSPAMLPAINEQINGALADPQLGVAAGVETDEGVIRLSLGM